MLELIGICLSLVVGGFVGFNIGAKRIIMQSEVAAQNFIDALRYKYGTVVKREITVGDGASEVAEFLELSEDLETLGTELFRLNWPCQKQHL